VPAAGVKRRKKLFLMALAAIIFAETGYILGTTGIGWMLIELFFGTRPLAFLDLVSKSPEVYVFYNGSVARADSRAVRYNDSYVHLIYYAGARLAPTALRWIEVDASEKPVYVIPFSPRGVPVNPADFYDALPKTAAHPVVLVICNAGDLERWLSYVSQRLQYRPSGTHIRIEIAGGEPVAARSLAD
jgi:hypothetical protein